MLETAGFSKSNPYYIVEQGKVTKITEMSDKQRLELLKEIAGTNVYEEKKDESLKIVRMSSSSLVIYSRPEAVVFGLSDWCSCFRICVRDC